MNSVKLSLTYPTKLSRLHLLAKFFLGWLYVGLPHGICLAVLGLCSFFLIIYAFFHILITGRYPEGVHRFLEYFLRWKLRVWAYWNAFLTDTYPPFSGKE